MAILPLLFLVLSSSSAQEPRPPIPITQPNCLDRCGNIEIPYPFGTTEDCYRNNSTFWVTCNQTTNPPKLFMLDSNIEILKISLDGQLRILNFIAHQCFVEALNGSGTTQISANGAWLILPTYITVNNTHNNFTIVGCDTYGYVTGERLNRHYATGCTAMCYAEDDLELGSCLGVGCCHTFIPDQVRNMELTLGSYRNYNSVKEFNKCGHAFLVEATSFSFSPENLTNLNSVQKLPMLVDWVIGNRTCEQVRDSSSYACKSNNSVCYKPGTGYGYRCSCKSGYRGNPYLVDGCHDINECDELELNKCEKREFCVNTDGNFNCVCPEGYHGDGKKPEEGKGCIPVLQEKNGGESAIYKFATGIALGVVILLLSACLLYLELKRRSSIKMKQQFFIRNGGHLLQEKLSRRERSPDNVAKLYSYSELQKATNNFHDSMIIGQGGFGTVYKAFLPDNRIVAIKKSKQVDPNQVEQFVNEVDVLSQINHRNVVKLLGCCLDTEAPLLVYEFISNGTLLEHVHDQAKARFLDWDKRLRIATETAGVLSYLHSAASPPIVHRDIKPANILLDDNLTAKVADFGASRLVPVDQTQLSTMVQGTFGYLDPEYMQTNQLTEKSDVYSFGVVLVELLTGRKALSYDKPELEKNLAHFFLYKLKQGRLFEIFDDNILSKASSVQLTEVARIAKGCLQVKGDDRPSMKEVAKELEGLRTGVQAHSWDQTKHGGEEMESLLAKGSNYPFFIGNGTDSSTRNTYDSLRDHIILPMQTGGR